MKKNRPKGHVFVDLDGTLIKHKPKELERLVFESAINNTFQNHRFDIDDLYNSFSQKDMNYRVQFIRRCRKHKNFGKSINLARLLMERKMFSKDTDLGKYIDFVNEYLRQEQIHAREIEIYDDSRKMLNGLTNDGYRLYLYSNWFNSVQTAKLQAHSLVGYFEKLYTIDNSYAKSSIKGWERVLNDSCVIPGELTIMVGNSSPDIIPPEFGMPSLIRAGSKSKYVQENGIIIESLDDVLPFLEEENLKRIRARQN